MMKFQVARSKETTATPKSEGPAESVVQGQWLHLDKTVSLLNLIYGKFDSSFIPCFVLNSSIW